MSDPIDLPSLSAFFHEHVGLSGALQARLLRGGKSNLTYHLTDGVSEWVLRRPPLGPRTPTAHDMAREFRVVSSLSQTDVPVAEAVALCEDESVIGAPFAVVSFIEGRSIQSGHETATLSRHEARTCSRVMIETLSSLHAVDYHTIGLSDFGRPDGYLERQVRRWRGQWEHVATRDSAQIDYLHGLLVKALPKQSAGSIVHGDFRLDNALMSADLSKVLAVIDWEMATLGDPLADLGLMLVYWDPVTQPVLGVRHAIAANSSFYDREEMVEAYTSATGRPVEHLSFYLALGYFKLAVIAEGIHQRFLAGQTLGDGFDTVGEAVPALLESGIRTLVSRAANT